MRRTPFLLATLLALLPAGVQASSCPSDSIRFLDYDQRQFITLVTTEPARTIVRHGGYDPPPTTADESGGYDLPNGRIEATAMGTAAINQYMLTADITVSTHDVYVIVGPAGGGPIAFTAQLRLAVDCRGEMLIDPDGMATYVRAGCLTALIGDEASGRVEQYSTCRNTNGIADLLVPMTRAVGEPFALRMQVNAEGTPQPDNARDVSYSRYASAVGYLAFPDLPAGYRVSSCQGYSGNVVVPAARTSWGQLKTHYR